MRAVVTIIFNTRQSLEIVVSIPDSPTSEVAAQARHWFEKQWIDLGCEPLRPSGKVLLLDKILGVADALGYQELSSKQALADQFATQCVLAVQANTVQVDLVGLSINY